MMEKYQIIVALGIAALFLLTLTTFTKMESAPSAPVAEELAKHAQNQILLKRQRDDLSSRMMRLSEEYHQYQCHHQPDTISGSGGWCQKQTTSYNKDDSLIKALVSLFKDQTVASFGEGSGRYKQGVQETDSSIKYDGFDGAPFCENSTDGVIQYLDLTVPSYGYKVYDWVMSLEVAEHIPPEYEQVYVDNLVRHARTGIVLSWARPQQKGNGHVNGRELDYVIKVMAARNFKHDAEYSKILQTSSTLSWMKQNVNVYRRNQSLPTGELWA